MRGIGGEIVQVQGGHIVRSTGRKDRHSKVYTAKGPRDRRVRLSAHTAIQFYDVQDRLGYDRPSKAVDWLIKNAKSAIDKLAELPAWHPKTGAEAPTTACGGTNNDNDNDHAVSGMEMGRTADESDELKELEPSGFVPSQHLDPVSDSMMNMMSRKDLGLSLQSFNVPKQQPEQTAPFFSHSLGFRFEAGDNDNYHRPATNNWSADNRNDDFSFNQMPTSSHPTVNLGGFNFSQRGTLQSSFSTMLHQFNGRFVSEGFPGMCIPGQMQDNEEESNTTASQKQPPSSTYGCLGSSGHSLKGI